MIQWGSQPFFLCCLLTFRIHLIQWVINCKIAFSMSLMHLLFVSCSAHTTKEKRLKLVSLKNSLSSDSTTCIQTGSCSYLPYWNRRLQFLLGANKYFYGIGPIPITIPVSNSTLYSKSFTQIWGKGTPQDCFAYNWTVNDPPFPYYFMQFSQQVLYTFTATIYPTKNIAR